MEDIRKNTIWKTDGRRTLQQETLNGSLKENNWTDYNYIYVEEENSMKNFKEENIDWKTVGRILLNINFDIKNLFLLYNA